MVDATSTLPAPSTSIPYPSDPNLFDLPPIGSVVPDAVQLNHTPAFDMNWPSSSAPAETQNVSIVAIFDLDTEILAVRSYHPECSVRTSHLQADHIG
jgi:hypothetical protein